jgi:hypothetical protein
MKEAFPPIGGPVLNVRVARDVLLTLVKLSVSTPHAFLFTTYTICARHYSDWQNPLPQNH